ncbi:MAG: PhzF family phenazine biosynthesis protein [Bacteroidales bacterium]|jgi:predicted PhzF superfamily epimerase YddE/YHI9|nr:PhzF family phenazine biosynthesis protein [Bacteroidales bacterium]
MSIVSYQVDSFTDKVFSGNPAVVVLLDNPMPDEQLKLIARENAAPETAFILEEDGVYNLRWFTPDIEMDLCGHATLASAHILFTERVPQIDEVVFQTVSGPLAVRRESDYYLMSFPIREGVPCVLPEEIFDSLSIKPKEVYKARDYMLVYPSQNEIEGLEINRSVFDEININPGGVIITAPGKDCDFVSRFFTPQATILEDPVTGSAHCTLTPYWAKRLKKRVLRARQISLRGGELECTLDDSFVIIKGKAVTFSKSELFIS